MMRSTWRQALASDAGLTVLLISLVAVLFVIFPFVPLSGAGRVVVTVGLTAVLVSGSFSLGEHPVLAIIVRVLAAVSLISQWLGHWVTDPAVVICAHLSTILFLALTSASILARVYRRGRVTPHRIQGAIAVYLMLGLIWAYAYALVGLGSPGTFTRPPTSVPEMAPLDGTLRDMVYFSFVTLTTLGYGDVTPVGAGARTLATLEALVGQLYLVVLIARLVSLEVAHSEREQE